MVTKFLPLPANSGGRQRSLAVARRLAQRSDLTLCAYDDGSSDGEGLGRLGITVRAVPWKLGPVRMTLGSLRTASASAGRFWSRELAAEVRRATTPAPDLLLVAYSQLAPFLHECQADRKIMDLHNVESWLMASYARSQGAAKRLAAGMEASALRRLEARALSVTDAVAVVSRSDAERLPPVQASVLVCPNGWEPEDSLPAATEPVAAFVALMSWAPNVDAAVWLAKEVWPAVIRQEPRARLVLVGRDPAPAVQSLARPDVKVTGTVPDVRPYLAATRVALAPLRAGGGTRLKILEALGAARPVVATTVGAEGLEDLIGEGLTVADDPLEMAGVIAGLLQDPERAAQLGRRGREAVMARYRWDRTLAPLLEWVDR
jgi:glycosyltransferase involved in cell wall biosynthesis